MVNLFNDIDDDALEIFNKIYMQNYQDLLSAFNDNLYCLNYIDAENDYKKLYLSKNQQIVIENYVDSLKVQKDKAVMIAYIKAIDHTIKFIKENKIMYNNNTPQN